MARRVQSKLENNNYSNRIHSRDSAADVTVCLHYLCRTRFVHRIRALYSPVYWNSETSRSLSAFWRVSLGCYLSLEYEWILHARIGARAKNVQWQRVTRRMLSGLIMWSLRFIFASVTACHVDLLTFTYNDLWSQISMNQHIISKYYDCFTIKSCLYLFAPFPSINASSTKNVLNFRHRYTYY